MNGWQEGTLATVMKTCRKGDGSNPQTLAEDSCFGQVGGMYTEQEVNACKIQQPIGPQQALKTVDALPGCQTITHVGVIADLKTCRDTTATLESGPVAGRSTPGYDAVSSPSRIIVKRPAVPPIPTMQLAKKRFVAGHGRSIEVNRGEFAF